MALRDSRGAVLKLYFVVVFAGGSSDDRAEINQKDCNSHTQHPSLPVRLLLS